MRGSERKWGAEVRLRWNLRYTPPPAAGARRSEHLVMSRTPPALADFRRIVVKVGSSLIIDAGAGRVKEDWLASLCNDIAGLYQDKRDLLVVSSGAIALGRAVLK